MSAASAPLFLSAAQLLELLQRRSGHEYWAQPVRAAHLPAAGAYRFAWGEAGLEATGPSAQTRTLSTQQFMYLFGATHFTATPTGRLTNLGPLFEPQAEGGPSLFASSSSGQ